MIIDTDVLIWFLRGNHEAIDFIMDATPFSISIVTYMELVQGIAFDHGRLLPSDSISAIISAGVTMNFLGGKCRRLPVTR